MKNDEKSDQDGMDARSDAGKDTGRARMGIIARLPKNIRNQINERLENGERARNILPWLNGLAAVQKILAEEFGGVAINRRHLSNWRQNEYQRWQKEQKRMAAMTRRSRRAVAISRAGKSLFRGAAAFASDRLFEALDSEEKIPMKDFFKMISPITSLARVEQNQERLRMGWKRLRLRDEQLALMWDKHRRNVVAIAYRVLKDDIARAIVEAPLDMGRQIEALGCYLFGPDWPGRKTAKTGENSAAAGASVGQKTESGSLP